MREAQQSRVALRQDPLRARFKAHPEEAISVKHVRASATVEADPLRGYVRAVGHEGSDWAVGLDAKVGGLDDLPNPGHLLCAALAACMDTTIRMLADRMAIRIERLTVDVVGCVDVRGCLAVSGDVRPGFSSIECSIELESDPPVDTRRTEMLLERARALCVTLDTLRHGAPVHLVPSQGGPRPRPRSAPDGAPNGQKRLP